MASTKRNFVLGRMNKSLDERLVPNGEYVDALNVRLGSTEESEIGSVENSKGVTKLTTITYAGATLSTSARCIGAYEDGARETIYWFIHDSDFSLGTTGKLDLIISLDINKNIMTYHVISIDDGDNANTILNFNPSYLITGVNMVDDLLFFTDDYNPPRFIDINKNYAKPTSLTQDGITSEELMVIKKPPLETVGINSEFVKFINNTLPEAKINFVSEELAEKGFTPSVFSLDLPTKGNTTEEKESYKRALNHKLINLMITEIPAESKYCVSYGQLKGCYWTIPATSTQGTTKEGDKDYIARVALSPNMDLERHKKVFLDFVNEI